MLHWPDEDLQPNIVDYLKERKIDLVINIPRSDEQAELDDDYAVRRKAVDSNVPLITDLQLAKRFAEALYRTGSAGLKPKHWLEYQG